MAKPDYLTAWVPFLQTSCVALLAFWARRSHSPCTSPCRPRPLPRRHSAATCTSLRCTLTMRSAAR